MARERLEVSRGRAALSVARPPRTAPPTYAPERLERMRARVRDGEHAPSYPRPLGSRLPLEVQDWIRAELANGASLNALANALGVSRDAIKVVRDGHSRHCASAKG